MPYQQPMPSTLEDIFRMNPAAQFQAQQMMEGGRQQNEQDLQGSVLKNMFDAANDPLRLRQAGLNADTTEAQLPGVQANSGMLQRKNSNEGILNNDALAQAKQEFMSKASDAHLKELFDKGQEMAYSLDPKMRMQGQQIMSMHKDMVKEREKQAAETARQLATTREAGSQARLTQQDAIDAGKFKKGNKLILTLDQAIDNSKSAKERHQKLIDAATQAEQEGEPDAAARYRARAEAIRPQAEAELLATPKPGTADLGALGVQANPNVNIAPTGKVDTSMFKAAFGGYEPDKYEYRINPETGKPQRKAK